MKKIIIISLILILSISLYFYHQEDWASNMKEVKQLKQEIEQPIKVKTPVEIEKESQPKQQDKKMVITSPFNSDLKVVEVQEKDDEPAENNKQQPQKKKKVVKIDKPELQLRGILRSGDKALVTVMMDEQLKRLKKGDKVNGYQLVKVLRDRIVFKKEDKTFIFKLADK